MIHTGITTSLPASSKPPSIRNVPYVVAVHHLMPPAVHPRFSVVEPETARVRYDPWIERLAWLTDSSIGIGRWSVGIDGLLGLVPGIGDAAGALISLLIVMLAVRAGVPRIAVARMLTNIVIDTTLGSVPLAGDLFDFAFKSNMKNLRIYTEYLDGGSGGSIRHWGFFALLALVLLTVVALLVGAALLLVRAALYWK
ncbi:MAG: DUF4112 domain-containing protein [Acidobacteria bacterium]|nr:DUF4112 domain-containing protein [Acidobacteriota bacterium]